jgi:hypothetical protein
VARTLLGFNNYFNAIDIYKPLFFGVDAGKAFFEECLADIEPMLAYCFTLYNGIDEDGVASDAILQLKIA